MHDKKKLIYNHLLSQLNIKINTARVSVENAKESRNNETKSSAGDKHETGRAMSQIELENTEAQLNKILDQVYQLSQISISTKHNRVENGSLVKTTQGVYFIFLGVGKLEVNNEIFYSISLASPIGMALHNKKIGENFHFQGKQIEILDIV